MKKTILLNIFILLGFVLCAQTPFYSLDFETAGGYTTSVPEFTDGAGDYFIRTDGSDYGSYIVYDGPVGSYFFAGMDLDGEGATNPLFLDIADIDITGQTNLVFRIYLAEDDDGTNQDWDDTDYMHIGYDIDNTGTFTPLLWVEGSGGTNTAPLIDTDFDGTGDGTEITNNFVQFTVAIPGSGTEMDMQFEFRFDAGDEDIAIDHIELLSGSGVLPLDANFLADQTNVENGTTINFTDMTSGGVPSYTYAWDLDGDGFYDDSTDPNPSYTYNTDGTYTVALKVIDSDLTEDIETKTDYITVYSVNSVSDIATLRGSAVGGEYILTGEVVLTFQQTFRNQKYIQDGTAGILIDDNGGAITTTYAVGDGITGIIGTLGEYGGMMQFVPASDPGAPTAGYTITPQIITLADLTTSFDTYESELVTINDLSFTGAGGIFANGQVYPVTDASGSYDFRTTFYSVDYIGGTIPATVDLTVIPNSRTDGDYITARNLADFTIGGFPTITKAYCLSETEIDVYYSIAPSSVDPGDYELTGSTNIYFNNADIDATDPLLVHLSNTTIPMLGDNILDLLYDGGYDTDYEFYAGIMPIEYTNTANPGGTMLEGKMATFQGIVSANDGSFKYWLHDAAGQYNGILVYGASYAASVPVGDEILIAGISSPYSNLSELAFTTYISTVAAAGTPYGPDVIPATDIEETIAADTSPAEPWEGQLVKIEDFTVQSYADNDYTCTWSDADVDYTFHIGDGVDFEFPTISLTVGASYTSITGVIDWDYHAGTLYYRINPRTQADIEVSSNPAVKLAIVAVNGGLNPYTNTDFNVVVQAQDASSNPALVASDINFTLTTDGGVDFVGGTTTNGILLNGTSEIILTGVQMAPAGTNVTITAKDDQIFGGLLAGISAPFSVIDFVNPEIIITEVMQNPFSAGDDVGEWFEVYNNSANPTDMNGWVIKDNDNDSITIVGSLVVPAYGFAVLGINADIETNGGYVCDYEYSDMALSNSGDELVLALPDGVTEVNRIEWGSGWPSPNGSSMTFTGFPDEDNNVGSEWVYSTLRELSYNETGTDKGSPGTNGYDQILTGGFKLDMTVFLEAAYETPNSMSNYYRQEGLLPNMHPFNPTTPYYGNNTPAWLYAGTDTASYIPYQTVDYLLVELRDASSAAGAGSGTIVAQFPVFLNDTGTITSLNGKKPLNITFPFTNDMYVVIWSVNHLSIMSSTGMTPAEGTIMTYDFSTGSGQVYGGASGYKEVDTGIWGMMSGDINGDQVVDDADNLAGWETEVGAEAVYQGSNLFLDNQIDNKDKNDFWVPNYNKATSVPN